MFGLNQMGLNLLQDDLKGSRTVKSSSGDFHKSHALYWVHESRYSNAGPDNDDVFQDLLKRHPLLRVLNLQIQLLIPLLLWMNQWFYPAYVGFQRALVQGFPNFGLSTYLMQWLLQLPGNVFSLLLAS